MPEEFSLRLNHILTQQKKSYFAERHAIDSRLANKGTFRSGAAWKLNYDLAVNNLTAITDEALRFSLSYASAEGIYHQDLVEFTETKLNHHKDEICADLDKRVTQIGAPSIQSYAIAAREELTNIITDKTKLALKGWINSEKIYSGSTISPSLKFFNLLCGSYDEIMEQKAPHIKKRFNAAYESMSSDNPSHWANAVHECRKVFEDLADLVFPAKLEPEIRGNTEISVTQEKYKNRLTCYVESKKESESYNKVVSAELKDFHSKLDALINATQKGSHTSVTKEHAALYIGQIYILVGSILRL